MAEARARLHLRDYVRTDDVDMAIRIMLTSFIQTQKKSVQQMLERHFKQYLNFAKDSNSLILHLLNQEIDAELQFMEMSGRSEDSETVTIPLKDIQERVEEMNMTETDLMQFLRSSTMQKYGFKYNRRKKVITKQME